MASRRANDDFISRHPELLDEDLTSQAVIDRILALFEPLAWYHRFECRDLEKIPDGPCLLVANHSAEAIGEAFLMIREWHSTFPGRPLRMLAHRFVWYPMIRRIGVAQGMGALPAHPEVAVRAVARGCSLLLFPGGESEMGRSFAERHKVTLGRRNGFVRLARRTGRPIVPVVLNGSHGAYFIVPGGKWMADAIRLPSWLGVNTIPMTVGGAGIVATLLLPPLWPLAGLAALQSVLPMPAKIRARVIEPIHPRPDETDEQVAERVRQAMQVAMDEMVVERPSLADRIFKRLGWE